MAPIKNISSNNDMINKKIEPRQKHEQRMLIKETRQQLKTLTTTTMFITTIKSTANPTDTATTTI